jgi:hypothetical protein
LIWWTSQASQKRRSWPKACQRCCGIRTSAEAGDRHRGQPKALQQQRAERRALATEGREVSPEVKAFFARMIRPRGALPPEKP